MGFASMTMQVARQVLNKKDVTVDELWKLLNSRPHLFPDNRTSFEKMDDLLFENLEFYDYGKAIELLEDIKDDAYHQGQNEVLDKPGQYGLIEEALSDDD